jgi:type IV pilus assembly protein PilA
MFMKIHKRMKGEKGFTLIELLVVIIIIAILAAIAIPTFLGQRQKAQDAAAKSLVRNAMTTIESAYVDNRSYDVADTDLEAIEPSIHFNASAQLTPDALVDPATPGIALTAGAATCQAGTNDVEYLGDDTTFAVATESLSDNMFGVYTDKGAPAGGTTFVKIINGDATVGW